MSGSVFVEFSKESFYVGETVTGHIYVNINQDYGVGQIQLKLKGWESVMWIDMRQIHENPNNPQSQVLPSPEEVLSGSDCELSQTSTDSSDCKEKAIKGYFRDRHGRLFKVEHHVGGYEFLKLNIPLQTFGGGQVHPGQYQIPFQFLLNEKLPGTFSYKQSKEKGRIKYELRVKCTFNDGKERDFKHARELIVHEKPKQSYSEIKDITANTMSCCCISKGQTTFKVFFEKNSFYIGEQANLVCEIDNSKCSANVNSVNAQISHRITYKDRNGRTKISSRSLLNKTFGGLGANESAVGNEARKESITIENKIQSKKAVISPTAIGCFVKSEYFLIVSCDMDATCNGCCNQIPSVTLPIQIYPQPIHMPVFVPPSGWVPQQMPVYNIPMPDIVQPPM